MLTNVDNYLSVLPARHELQSKTPAHRDKESCGLPKLSTQRSGIFTFCQVYPKFTCFLSWLFLAAIIHARTHTTHCVRASVLPRASFPLSASTRTLHAPSASPKKKKKNNLTWRGVNPLTASTRKHPGKHRPLSAKIRWGCFCQCGARCSCYRKRNWCLH